MSKRGYLVRKGEGSNPSLITFLEFLSDAASPPLIDDENQSSKYVGSPYQKLCICSNFWETSIKEFAEVDRVPCRGGDSAGPTKPGRPLCFLN